ncbi:hypothetical protein GCM10023340_02380 [Nocardioides marinquilinus]|uniref:DUF3039 domain-containing protein n=1 Tax=Nocardioides marinquilinus TaxID=1210400 RepID=A0ABP9P6M7_9ACTN
MAAHGEDDDERIVEATVEQVVAVAEQMVDLPWPDGDDSLPWVIDGLEGETLWLAHALPLASRATQAETRALVEPLVRLAGERWGARHHFDATRFTDDASTDPASYDRRSAVAGMVRALGADEAVWWRHREYAVVLVDSSHLPEAERRVAVLVLEADWLGRPGQEEEALASPLVADLLSGDTRRVISASWAVIATRDPEVLAPLVVARPAIERATADLDLGGALMSNEWHLRHALRRVELFAAGSCLCLAYPDHQTYDVEKEVERGHVRVVETVPNERQWVPDRICECTACGRRYQVEQGEYHYPWWAWRPVPDLSPAQVTEREASP